MNPKSLVILLLIVIASIPIASSATIAQEPGVNAASVGEPTGVPPVAMAPPHSPELPAEPSVLTSSDVQQLIASLKSIEKSLGRETFLTKLRDEFLSDFLWEIFGYHRDRGGILPLLITVGSLLTGLIKIWLLLRPPAQGSKPYALLDWVVSVAFVFVALFAVLLVLRVPGIGQPPSLDLAAIEAQLEALNAAAERIQGTTFSLEESQVAAISAAAAKAGIEVARGNQNELVAVSNKLDGLIDSTPGLGCASVIALLAAIGALASIWLVGRALDWW